MNLRVFHRTCTRAPFVIILFLEWSSASGYLNANNEAAAEPLSGKDVAATEENRERTASDDSAKQPMRNLLLDTVTLCQIHYASALFDRADELRRTEKELNYARELAGKAAKLVLDIYGPTAPEFARCLNLRASIECAMREFERSESMLTQAKSIFDAWGPEDGWQRVEDSVTCNLALVSLKLGKHEAAEFLYEDLLSKYQEHERPVECGLFNIFLGHVYLETSKSEKAKECIERGYMLISRAVPKSDKRHIAAIVALGRLRHSSGDYESAEKLLVSALELEQGRSEGTSLGYSDIKVYLGSVYIAQQRRELAVESLEAALDIRKTVLGDDHPLVEHTATSLQAIRVAGVSK